MPIDNVRVISNTATGQTGILLAKKLTKLGARVTLVLGPVCLQPSFLNYYDCFGLRPRNGRYLRILRFKFFDELKNIVIKELKSKKYDIVIHSAAVSDYQPRKVYKQKIKSGIKVFTLNLVPAPKIIDLIKKSDRELFVTAFKFETEAGRNILINKAKALLKSSGAHLVVANTFFNRRYRAYIIDAKDKISAPILSKEGLSAELVKKIGEAYGCA